MNHDSLSAPIQESLVRESFLAMGLSSPNPPVAAVITDDSNRILFQAHTQRAGLNHAEREVYRQWDEDKNHSPTKDSSHHLFVSLEPCTHFGRTAPCRDLVLSRKPLSISVGSLDPNPLVSDNRDQKNYSDTGIKWNFSDEIKICSKDFLEPFFTRVTKNRPKVVIKTAVSKEENFAADNQGNLTITNSQSNQVLSLLRSKVDCILVGPKTVALDNPSLDFRIPDEISRVLQSLENNPKDSKSHPLLPKASSKNQLTNGKVQFDFWSRLVYYSKDISVWQELLDQFLFYQPKRAFILSPSLPIDNKFYEKQNLIQESFKDWIQGYRIRMNLGTELDNLLLPEVIFFIMEENTLTPNEDFNTIINQLKMIPNSKIISIPRINFGTNVLEILSELGVNLLLVEGGNLLYKEFYEILEPQDEILYMRSQDISIPSGIKPVFAEKLKKEIYHTQINSDIWKVYKKE